jgi:ankyrin repeat protein
VRQLVDEEPDQRQNAFLYASTYGHSDVVEFLLDRGVDVRDPGKSGATALHWAAGNGDTRTIKMLLDRGAPLEDINRWGGTVIEHAGWGLANNDPSIDFAPAFEMLLAAGAKLQDGWLRWLEKKELSSDVKTRLANVLRRYGARD